MNLHELAHNVFNSSLCMIIISIWWFFGHRIQQFSRNAMEHPPTKYLTELVWYSIVVCPGEHKGYQMEMFIRWAAVCCACDWLLRVRALVTFLISTRIYDVLRQMTFIGQKQWQDEETECFHNKIWTDYTR